MNKKPLPEWAKPSLLPYCASDLEHELDQALSHIETVEIPIRDLWNPWKCPLVALPYLAWAVKVTNWDAKWSERVKRQVVADSLDVHRIRGTRSAVEKALLSISVRCEIVEWFEKPSMNMEPGTFRVTAWATTGDESNRIDAGVVEQIREVVNAAKPASRPFVLEVNGAWKASYGIAAALRMTRLVPLRFHADGGWIPPTNQLKSEIGVAAALRITKAQMFRMETGK